MAVGAEHEREQLELQLQRRADLQGLSGCLGQDYLGKDYRDMRSKEAADGGFGTDFRERDRFGKRTRARDFENEAVLADALRFLFRRAPGAAEAFGETPETVRRRIPVADLPRRYFEVAADLRHLWENQTAAGAEQRSFGKAMLDQCQAWAAAFKKNKAERCSELQRLLAREAVLTDGHSGVAKVAEEDILELDGAASSASADDTEDVGEDDAPGQGLAATSGLPVASSLVRGS